MNKFSKRLFSTIITALMFFTLVPIHAESVTVGNFSDDYFSGYHMGSTDDALMMGDRYFENVFIFTAVSSGQ